MSAQRLFRMTQVLVPAMALLFAASCSNNEEEPNPPETARPAPKLRAPLEYKDVGETKGALRRATLFSQKVGALAAPLEVHSLLLLPREVALPTERETLYEVRAGTVMAITGEEKKSHPTGDIWLVGKGAHVTLKAQGEIAVLRAISLAASK
jgi:hypothetical protein